MVRMDCGGQLRRLDLFQVRPARQKPSPPDDGILNSPYLPRRLDIAKVSLDALGVPPVAPGKLGAVVKSYAAPQLRRQRRQDPHRRRPNGFGGLAARTPSQQPPEMALVPQQQAWP